MHLPIGEHHLGSVTVSHQVSEGLQGIKLTLELVGESVKQMEEWEWSLG